MRTSVRCKFLPDVIEIHFQQNAPDQAEAIDTFKVDSSEFLAAWFQQGFHTPREVMYTVPLPSTIETSHSHITRHEGDGVVMYHIPVEKNQAEML